MCGRRVILVRAVLGAIPPVDPWRAFETSQSAARWVAWTMRSRYLAGEAALGFRVHVRLCQRDSTRGLRGCLVVCRLDCRRGGRPRRGCGREVGQTGPGGGSGLPGRRVAAGRHDDRPVIDPSRRCNRCRGRWHSDAAANQRPPRPAVVRQVEVDPDIAAYDHAIGIWTWRRLRCHRYWPWRIPWLIRSALPSSYGRVRGPSSGCRKLILSKRRCLKATMAAT